MTNYNTLFALLIAVIGLYCAGRGALIGFNNITNPNHKYQAPDKNKQLNDNVKPKITDTWEFWFLLAISFVILEYHFFHLT